MNSNLPRGVAAVVAAALILGLGVFHAASAQRAARTVPGAQPGSSEAIRPFKINVPEADLVDLKQRLARIVRGVRQGDRAADRSGRLRRPRRRSV